MWYSRLPCNEHSQRAAETRRGVRDGTCTTIHGPPIFIPLLARGIEKALFLGRRAWYHSPIEPILEHRPESHVLPHVPVKVGGGLDHAKDENGIGLISGKGHAAAHHIFRNQPPQWKRRESQRRSDLSIQLCLWTTLRSSHEGRLQIPRRSIQNQIKPSGRSRSLPQKSRWRIKKSQRERPIAKVQPKSTSERREGKKKRSETTHNSNLNTSSSNCALVKSKMEA